MKYINTFLIFLSLLGQHALANDTAMNEGAYGPAPVGGIKGGESVVRMVSEKIDVTFSREKSEVDCRFVFRSTKKSGDARQLVGFPDSGILDEGDSAGPIQNLKTFVDGKEVEAKRESGWLNTGAEGEGILDGNIPEGWTAETLANRSGFGKVYWFTVWVTFPSDHDVIVERKYTVANGGNTMGVHFFNYTTATGSPWQGTIGEAEINVTLEGLTIDDLAFEDSDPPRREPNEQFTYSNPNRKEWEVLSPSKLHMIWKDFEPRIQQTRRGFSLVTWSKPPTVE